MSNCELCGEPMPEGEEMFKYHGYSGPCPKPPLEKVRAGVSGIVPQGPTFHWKDGWFFCRGEGLAVHIWNTEHGAELIIPRGEWDSIVGHLSHPDTPR
jgi:hypothetical protein